MQSDLEQLIKEKGIGSFSGFEFSPLLRKITVAVLLNCSQQSAYFINKFLSFIMESTKKKNP